MSDDIGFEELAPGRYDGVVERIRYNIGATTKIVITYKLTTADGPRRVEEEMLISAPPASVSYFHTTQGLGRVEDILRIRGLSLADADGLRSLPGLLEGTVLGVIMRNQRRASFNCPIVTRVEK